MKINNTITITGEIKKNDYGTHEWGDFVVTSNSPLEKRIVTELAAMHGFGGQSFTFSETTTTLSETSTTPHTYTGAFDCWSD